MAPVDPTRVRLLDAALALVIADGVQAVSHRAVEERAGVARGSTRYHFGTRDQLLADLVGHLADRDHALLQRASDTLTGDPSPSADARRQALAAAIDALLADREGALARLELSLYAARRPELAAVFERWRATFVGVAAAELRRAGAPDPDRGAEALVATMDGIVLRELISPGPARHDLGASLYALAARASGLEGA